MKLNLTYIDRKERVSAKSGKPFTSVSIKAKEYNDKFLSGFGNKENASWQVGQEVEVAEVREVSKDGKIYLNFEMPRYGGNGAGPEVMKRFEEVENNALKRHLLVMQGIKEVYEAITAGQPKSTTTPNGTHYPTPEEEGITLDHTAEDDGLEHLNEENLNSY